MKKKTIARIRRVLIVFTLLAVIVCVFPFPIRVKETYQGLTLDEKGNVSTAEVFLEGWYLNFLIRPNKINGSIRIVDSEESEVEFDFLGDVFDLKDGRYSTGTVSFVGGRGYRLSPYGSVDFTKNFKELLIKDDGIENVIFAPAETQEDIESISEFFHYALENSAG